MIVVCPSCAARFRLDRQRLGGKRITLRCTRCRSNFKVEIPSQATDSPRLRVAVAHGDPALCSTIRELVTAEGMDCRVWHDAESFLRSVEAAAPQVAIVDVAIPGLYIFELVSHIRTLPNLAETRIILLSAVYNRAAYKRTPTSLYGADDYIEKHHLPDDLVPKIYALTANACPTIRKKAEEAVPGVATPAPEPADCSRDEMNSRILEAEQAAAATGEAVEKARRLARTIVADIALYSQEKVEEGIRTGTLHHLLASEIEEGRRLLAERIAPEIRERGDFLGEAFAAFIDRRRREMET